MNKYAYATVITNLKYLPCIIKCAENLRYIKSKYPYIILVSDQIPKKNLIELSQQPNIIIKTFQYTNYLYDLNKYEFKDFNSNQHEANTLQKIQVLNLTEYETILFIDADMIIVSNSDECFESNKFKTPMIFDPDFSLTNIDGSKFLCHPNKKFFNFLKTRINNTFFYSDEELFNNYCYSFQQNIKDIDILHFYGMIKLWNINNFSLNDFLFNKCPIEKFHQILTEPKPRRKLEYIIDNLHDLSNYSREFLEELYDL